MMLHTRYQGSRPCGFRQEAISYFPYRGLCKTFDPRAGHFWSQGHNLNKLRRSLLHTKYQGSMPNGFRQEECIMFSLYKPRCKTCDHVVGQLLAPVI